MATVRNVATPTSDVFDAEPTPQTPWPDVQPLPIRVPIPTRIPPRNSRQGWTDVDQSVSPPTSYSSPVVPGSYSEVVTRPDWTVAANASAPRMIPSVNTTRQSREPTYCWNRDWSETYDSVDSRNVLAPAGMPVPT